MADPASMAMAAGSSIIGAIGAGTTAAANAGMYTYKAGIAQLNAQVDKQNAAWAVNSGGIKATEEGLKDAQEKGTTTASFGASGIDVATGSHGVVSSTQTDVAKFNQGIIRADAAHAAYGYEVKAASDSAEASMDTAAASNAKTAGTLGILSSLIGGASSVASKWSQGNMIGLNSSNPGPIGTFDPNNYGAAPSWSGA